MITRTLRYLFITVIAVVLQSVVARYLNVAGVSPDLLALWIVVVALGQGQLAGTVWGFTAGLLLDLMTGNFIGLSALTKTLGGFIAGYFYEEDKLRITMGSYRFLIIVFLSSVLQHTLYFIVFTRGSDINLVTAIVELGVTTTLYTTLISLFPVMIIARRSATVNVE